MACWFVWWLVQGCFCLQIGGIPFVGDATDLRYCEIHDSLHHIKSDYTVWTLDWQPTTIPPPPPNPQKEVHELGQKLKAEQDQKLGGVNFFGTGVFFFLAWDYIYHQERWLNSHVLVYPLTKATFLGGCAIYFPDGICFFFSGVSFF